MSVLEILIIAAVIIVVFFMWKYSKVETQKNKIWGWYNRVKKLNRVIFWLSIIGSVIAGLITGLIMYTVVSHPDDRVICQVTQNRVNSYGHSIESRSTYHNVALLKGFIFRNSDRKITLDKNIPEDFAKIKNYCGFLQRETDELKFEYKIVRAGRFHIAAQPGMLVASVVIIVGLIYMLGFSVLEGISRRIFSNREQIREEVSNITEELPKTAQQVSEKAKAVSNKSKDWLKKGFEDE